MKERGRVKQLHLANRNRDEALELLEVSGSPEPLRCPNGMQTRCQSEHGTSSLLSGPQQLSPAHNDWNVDSKSGHVTGDL